MTDRQLVDSPETYKAIIRTADGRTARAECIVVDGTALVRAHDGQVYVVSREWLDTLVMAYERLQLPLALLATYPNPDDAPKETRTP